MSKRKRDYDEVSVVRALNNKKGCVIKGKEISVAMKQSDLGNSSWGKIDFLVKHCGFTQVNVEDLPHNNHFYQKPNKRFGERDDKTKPKGGSFNMSDMVKKSMKDAHVTG